MRVFLGGFVPAVLLSASAFAQSAGDVVVTELMIEARSDRGEWIEVFAPGAEVDLAGCFLRQIRDGGGGETVELDGLVVGAGEYAVLSRVDPCVLYDEEGSCALPADFIYDSLSLTNSGGEVLIECGATELDRVAHDWRSVEEDCTTANAVCSVNLAPDAFGATGDETASNNDDWSNWCVPPASNFGLDAIGLTSISTPGAPNACPEPGAACGPGDAVFTELMVRAPNAQREWFELLVTPVDGCDLQGCRLQEGPESDPFLGPTEEHWDFHTLDAPGNVLEIPGGTYAVFAKGELEIGTNGDTAVTATNIYSGISFGDSEPGWLHLLCGGVVVDSAPYDWGAFADSCPEGGCSVGVVDIHENADSNDDLSRWCLPPQEPVWTTSEDLPFRGTPGAAGVCDAREWPLPGEVLFSELMVAPAEGFPEWFELTDVSSTDHELAGCRVERFRLEVDGTVDPSSVVDYVLGADETLPELLADASVAFGRNCINGAIPEEGGECTHEEYFYGSVSFGNSEAEFVDLWCPDGIGGERLIDRAGYDMTSTGLRSGHSLQFEIDAEAEPGANDDPFAWCEASFADVYGTVAGVAVNFGTPGVATPCRTGTVEQIDAGPGCSCRTADAEVSSWWMLLAVLGLRRRRTM